MELQMTPELARVANTLSTLNAEDFRSIIVMLMLEWKGEHPDADTISDILMDVTIAMVRAEGGEVVMREVDEVEWEDEFGDDWYED